VPRVDVDKLTADRCGELSEAIRARVERARETQRERFAGTPLASNADMGPTEVREICRLDETGRGLVKAAMQQLGMSTRLLRNSKSSPHPQTPRMIADLAGSERIETPHPSAALRAGLAEAIQYRPRRAG
jgi:magnesium chelatase family protein